MGRTQHRQHVQQENSIRTYKRRRWISRMSRAGRTDGMVGRPSSRGLSPKRAFRDAETDSAGDGMGDGEGV